MTRAGMRLSRLLKGARLQPEHGPGNDPEILGIEMDSRRIEQGHLFCAVRGFRVDGVSFVPQAVERGAVAVLAGEPRPGGLDPDVVWVQVTDVRRATALAAREWHERPDETMTLVGITGTDGKTSVAYLLDAMGRAGGQRTGRIGTIGQAWGGRERPAARTTPEAPDLFAALAEMRDDDVQLVTMEVSSHALELGRVEGARFEVGAFLNLSRDHLDFHGGIEGYYAAKARLIRELESGATAVLPADDSRGDALGKETRARVVTFGRSDDAAIRITREQCTLDGSRATLATPAGEIEVDTPLVGTFVIDNLAAATACALSVGLPVSCVSEGARDLESIPGRMEPVANGQPFSVLVDYAHTENALGRLLATVQTMTANRVIVVFGCGGDRDQGKRQTMGRIAAEGADVIFLTSDNPRNEDPGEILAEIERGVLGVAGAEDRCHVLEDRREAFARAIAEARTGDVVVLAGKGHETTQTFADRIEPFDDREVAAHLLSAAGWKGGCCAGA